MHSLDLRDANIGTLGVVLRRYAATRPSIGEGARRFCFATERVRGCSTLSSQAGPRLRLNRRRASSQALPRTRFVERLLQDSSGSRISGKTAAEFPERTRILLTWKAVVALGLLSQRSDFGPRRARRSECREIQSYKATIMNS